MLGAVFPGDRTVNLLEFPDPSPGPGEVVLQMKASGICGSDLKRYRGAALSAALTRNGASSAPVIAGHEPCGEVVAVGAGVAERVARPGDRMMVHHYKGCGCCTHCFSGWTQNCAELSASYGNNAHGGHAHYMKVPAATLVRLPHELSWEVGAAISCGTGTAWGALKRADASGRDTVLVVGQGPVGLAVTQFATAMGCRVIAMDISADRLATARDFGADATVNPKDCDAVQAVRDLTAGLGASICIDTSGTAAGGLDAVRCAATWGTVVFVGMGGSVQLDISEHVIRKQLSIQGSWTFSLAWQAECTAYVQQRKIPVERLFTHRWTLEQADEAYRLFDTQSTGKAVILL